jgi:hypothetical protein
MQEAMLPARVYVELPNGQWLVPGQTPGCPGPTASGECPVAREGAVRPCVGGAWFKPGSLGWRAEFVADDALCPLTVLDPLGPADVPLD